METHEQLGFLVGCCPRPSPQPAIANSQLLLKVWPYCRPSIHVQAAVDGAVNIPIFEVEDELSFNAFLKKASAFGMGGWWLGGTHMKPNMGFLREVEQKIPKDSRVIVACQKGLR